MINGNKFIDAYISWLRERITFLDIGDAIEISTPFLDNHNDHIQLYIKQDKGRIVITDDGYTISNLIISGCDLSSNRRKDILQGIINGFGVKCDGRELYIEASEHNYPQKKHALLQAVISVSDMFMLAHSRVSGVFLEDVESYLNKHDIRYTPAIQIPGKSGFHHTYDFIIPASRQKPERLIRAINNPTKEKAESVLFSWDDIKNMRKNDSIMYVIMNDFDRNIRSGIIEAFLQYEIETILWSKRDQYTNELAA